MHIRGNALLYNHLSVAFGKDTFISGLQELHK